MSALDIQIGGEHYKTAKIQPIQYIEANGLGFLEGCVVKRVTRHDKPTGKGRQDIEKAIHELQLLLEFRYPVSPDMTDALAFGTALHQALASRTNPPGEDIYAEFAARTVAPVTFHERVAEIDRDIQIAMAARILGTVCPECGYPTDAAGTHYATCSQLTAPEEYKAEAQVAFDEAAELSEALARQVSAGTLGENYCPQCGAAEGAFHNPDCTILRRGKSWLSQTPAHAGPDSATPGHTIRPPEEVLAEVSEAWRRAAEPAAVMDDDSPRMQAIGQNGNDGEHYDDPFAGAPEWAKYKAQDADGEWRWYSSRPAGRKSSEYWTVFKGSVDIAGGGEPNPNWRDTLITRT